MDTLTPHAAAAKSIRKELAYFFPSVKFSVRSETFAGGNSVRVSWQNGPKVESVCAIIGKYQYGEFDGMNDIYEVDNQRDDIPQVKYVQTSREITEEIFELAFQKVQPTLIGWENISNIDEASPSLLKEWNVWTAREYLSRLLRSFDLTNFNMDNLVKIL